MEKKDQELHFFVTKSDQERIHQKMAEMGIHSKSAYLRKMALDGYCVKLDLQDVKELVSLLRRCSNNLNQYAKRANETGSIYQEDIRDLQAVRQGTALPSRIDPISPFVNLAGGKRSCIMRVQNDFTKERTLNMWLLKLPFKILALPVILLLGVFWVLGKIMTNLSAFVVGIFMLFIFLVGIFCAFQGQWGNVAFLIGVEVACLVLQYGAMMIVDISGSINGALVRFLHS